MQSSITCQHLHPSQSRLGIQGIMCTHSECLCDSSFSLLLQYRVTCAPHKRAKNTEDSEKPKQGNGKMREKSEYACMHACTSVSLCVPVLVLNLHLHIYIQLFKRNLLHILQQPWHLLSLPYLWYWSCFLRA